MGRERDYILMATSRGENRTRVTAWSNEYNHLKCGAEETIIVMTAQDRQGQFENGLLEIGGGESPEIGIITQPDIDITQLKTNHGNKGFKIKTFFPVDDPKETACMQGFDIVLIERSFDQGPQGQ